MSPMIASPHLPQSRRDLLALAFASIWIFSTGSALGAIHNIEADFSITANPNGAWSYGYTSTLGGPFNLYATAIQDAFGILGVPFPGFDQWAGSIATDGNPSVIHNRLPGVNSSIGWFLLYDPGQVVLHPGPTGEYSVARWTAPTTETFDISAVFTGIDAFGGGRTSTDVHVLLDGTPIFGDAINGFLATATFGAGIALYAGQTIDFAVGYGSNVDFNGDSTRIQATITGAGVIPEAPTWCAPALLVFVGAAHRVFRRVPGRA